MPLPYTPVVQHTGFQIQTMKVRGKLVGTTSVAAGDLVHLKMGDASAASTTIYGLEGTHAAWESIEDAVAADLECGTFGVAQGVADTGDELDVIIQGDNVAVNFLPNATPVAVAAGSPLFLQPADADHALLNRADAVTATGLAQTIRFRASLDYVAGDFTGSTVRTIKCDVDGFNGFGYSTGV